MNAAIPSGIFTSRSVLSVVLAAVISTGAGCAGSAPSGSTHPNPVVALSTPAQPATPVPQTSAADDVPARQALGTEGETEEVAADVGSPNSETASTSESWLGVSMKQTPQGVTVSGVLRGSPAASAGLLKGDRLVRVGGKAVSAPTDVAEAVRAQAVGTRLDLDVQRGSETRMLYAITTAKPNREEMIRSELVGYQAPSISELRTVQGTVVPSWNQLRGQVVLLEFWASWCVACRALAPTLNAWQDELSPSGVQILGITMDPYDEAERASRSLKFATFTDEPGDVTLSYQGTALPTLVIVDRQGIVRDVMVGLDFERLPSIRQTLIELASGQATPMR